MEKPSDIAKRTLNDYHSSKRLGLDKKLGRNYKPSNRFVEFFKSIIRKFKR